MPSPPLMASYIDPSAGQIFTSIGPIIVSFIGAGIGFLAVFAKKIKTIILSVFKKTNENKKNSSSGN